MIKVEKTTKISVIIPVYNSEQYIRDCMDSILGQTLPDIEVICVDDGSDDASAQILEDIRQKDARVMVKSCGHKGVSAARNEGMKLSKGKYIYFMDSDDMLEKHALEHLFNAAEKDGLDILFFNGKACTDDRSFSGTVAEQNSMMMRSHQYPGVRDGVRMMENMYSNSEYWMTVWLQLYRREFCLENSLSFYEGIIHEDNLFAFVSILSAKRCGYLDEYLYLKRVRPESITTVRTNFDHIYGYYTCFMQMEKYLAENSDKRNGAAEEIMSKSLSEARRVCALVDRKERYKYLELPYEEQVIFKGLILDYMQTGSFEEFSGRLDQSNEDSIPSANNSGILYSIRRLLHHILPASRHNVSWSHSNLTAQNQVQLQLLNHVMSENLQLENMIEELAKDNRQIREELAQIRERIGKR